MSPQRRAVKTIALRKDPLVEALLVELEPLEKVAAIEFCCLGEGLRCPGAGLFLEVGDVDVHERRIEGEKVAFLDEELPVRGDVRQLFPKTGEGLAQRLSGLFGGRAAPEEAGHFVPRNELRRLDAEIRQHG